MCSIYSSQIHRIFRLFIFILVLIFLFASGTKIRAAESGVSFYVPGLYGDTGVAIPPSPGAYLLATSIYYPAKAPHPLLPGEVDKRLETETFAQLLRGFWVPKSTFFGAQMLMGFRISALDVNVEADIETPFGLVQLNGNNKGYGDLSLLPLSLYWQQGNFYINLYEVISIPTSKFDQTRLANISLNHWVFDTVLAMTWLDPKIGIEISTTSGIIYNTDNPDTNYQTGLEFHMDVMLNWHYSSSLSVGVHGSIYQQLTGDKSADPFLGAFKGQSYSIGPAIIWNKNIGRQKYYLSAKWLNEFNAKNRVEGDLTIITMGIKF